MLSTLKDISIKLSKSFLGAMGYYVYMDENGDAEGNYTLIARKEVPGSPGKYGLFPVAIFQLAENRSNIQVGINFLSLSLVPN